MRQQPTIDPCVEPETGVRRITKDMPHYGLLFPRKPRAIGRVVGPELARIVVPDQMEAGFILETVPHPQRDPLRIIGRVIELVEVVAKKDRPVRPLAADPVLDQTENGQRRLVETGENEGFHQVRWILLMNGSNGDDRDTGKPQRWVKRAGWPAWVKKIILAHDGNASASGCRMCPEECAQDLSPHGRLSPR